MAKKAKRRASRPQPKRRPRAARKAPSTTPVPTVPDTTAIADPPDDGLKPIERLFVSAYNANGGNGTRAYLAVRPDVTEKSAAELASKLLRKIKVAEAVRRGRLERWKQLEISADDAMYLIAQAATADLADAYDEAGELLPFPEWPEHLRLAVREIREDGTVKLLDPLKAREMIAVDGGRIKRSLEVNLNAFDHGEYLASRTDEHGKPVPPAGAPKP